MIRVVRVLEYTYSNQEELEKDMAQWEVPAMGVKECGPTGHPFATIRSGIILPRTEEAE